MSRFLWSMLAVLLASSSLLANGAPFPLPKQPAPPILGNKTVATKLTVLALDGVKEPRLVVPLNLASPQPQGPPRRGADAGNMIPTIIAGTALTLAFVMGGLWFVRKGKARFLAAGLVLCLFTAGASILWADIAFPGRPRPDRPQPPVNVALPAGIQLGPNVQVEFVPNGEGLVLIVGKDMVIGNQIPQGVGNPPPPGRVPQPKPEE